MGEGDLSGHSQCLCSSCCLHWRHLRPPELRTLFISESLQKEGKSMLTRDLSLSTGYDGGKIPLMEASAMNPARVAQAKTFPPLTPQRRRWSLQAQPRQKHQRLLSLCSTLQSQSLRHPSHLHSTAPSAAISPLQRVLPSLPSS